MSQCFDFPVTFGRYSEYIAKGKLRMLRPVLGAALGIVLLTGCDVIRVPGGDVEATAPETLPEPDPETPTEITETLVPEASGIADLLEINATRCGLTLGAIDESQTFAELMDAQPARETLASAAAINGDGASLIDFPGIVKMEPRKILGETSVASGHCSATRISEHWFVTAAHCLDDDYDEVMLVTRSETLSSPLAKRVFATSSICHAAFEGGATRYANDIALVYIGDNELAEIEGVPIAKFGATDDRLLPVNYSDARMAGWGLTSFRGSLSDVLLSATLTVNSAGPSAIRVQSQDGAGPCVGDSGGPLYVSEENGESVVVGVLSVVEQNAETQQFCEGDYGAVYTNLQGFGTWIDSVISACNGHADLCGL